MIEVFSIFDIFIICTDKGTGSPEHKGTCKCELLCTRYSLKDRGNYNVKLTSLKTSPHCFPRCRDIFDLEFRFLRDFVNNIDNITGNLVCIWINYNKRRVLDISGAQWPT